MGIVFGTYAPIIINTTGGTANVSPMSASCAIGIINWYNSSGTLLGTGNTYTASSVGTYYCDVTYDSRTTLTKTAVVVDAIPSVTTNSISNITTTGMTSGGDVTSSGTSTVTARGVCYSTSQNPTIDDSHTHDSSGTGTFTSNITGLTAGTVYYVRSYAINIFGTAYGNQQSGTTISKPTINRGSTYQGGVVFYITEPVDGATSGTSGLISRTTSAASKLKWGCYGTTVSGADGVVIGTGNQNTTDIINQGCSNTAGAAIYCYNLNDGTYSDWFLPSYNELYQMYVQKSIIGGFSAYYLISTEYNNQIWNWILNFNNGGWNVQERIDSVGYYVRAVRNF